MDDIQYLTANKECMQRLWMCEIKKSSKDIFRIWFAIIIIDANLTLEVKMNATVFLINSAEQEFNRSFLLPNLIMAYVKHI